MIQDNCGGFGLIYTDSYLSWDQGGNGRYLAFLVMVSVILLTLHTNNV